MKTLSSALLLAAAACSAPAAPDPAAVPPATPGPTAALPAASGPAATLPAASGPAAPVATPAAAAVIPDEARQLLTVVTPIWTSTDGTLRRWERTGAGWQAVGQAVPVVVGRSGLGWGIGLHGDADGARAAGTARRAEPGKAEGDGRAPAGAFRLASAFGYADTEPTGLPYAPATPTSVCIDDAASPRYNTVFDAGRDPASLGVSLERMRRDDALYRLGVIVDHNGGGALGTEPVRGAGSCIFLHVWRGPGTSTAGCTAMPDVRLAEVMAWLDAEAAPVLVQLPAEAYQRLGASWALPDA